MSPTPGTTRNYCRCVFLWQSSQCTVLSSGVEGTLQGHNSGVFSLGMVCNHIVCRPPVYVVPTTVPTVQLYRTW
jgi:hypothetical protein